MTAGLSSALAGMVSPPTAARAPRPRILCVDDDRGVLEGLTDVLGLTFALRTTTSPIEALEVLKRDHGFAVVLSDLRMPEMPGSEFLRMARLSAPDTVRIVLTGHADVPAAVRAVNGGQLYRFLTKPCDSQELMRACAAALGQHRLQVSERGLLQDTLRGCVEALAEVLALTSPAAFGRAGRASELGGALARAVRLPDWWEVEVAALLENLGAVTLPPATAEKLHAAKPLSDSEAAMVRRVPQITRQLLSKIPRLEGVLEILASIQSCGDPDQTGEVPAGARVLRTVLDYADLEDRLDSPGIALETMRTRELYDPQLLDTLAGIVGVNASPRVSEIAVGELQVGMTLADDARSTDDGLLLTRGQRVTQRLIERLTNLGADSIRQPLLVISTTDAER